MNEGGSCDADGRITSGLVFVPVNLIVFDDMGINHLPMNSGVGSLNSLWLPLQLVPWPRF